MTTEPRDEVSEENEREENQRKFNSIYVPRLVDSERLARAHRALAMNRTDDDVAWDDLTHDERVAGILAAYPWFLAARALWFDSCPRCGCGSSHLTDLGGRRKECPDCGHRFEAKEEE